MAPICWPTPTSLIYATGIANIWVRDPVTMAAYAKTLAEFAPNRFILGIGVRHRSLVADWRGHNYTKPFSYLNEYIAKMKDARYKAVAPEVEPPLVLAALHPKSLGLAAREMHGTHTYLCLPDHTKNARTLMGPEAGVCPSWIVILERNAVKARTRTRKYLSFYASQKNYQRILRTQGFADTDFENGGSDRLIDTMVAWGSEEQIQDKIDAQLAAGANHVCLMPLRGDDNSLPDERALEAFAPR